MDTTTTTTTTASEKATLQALTRTIDRVERLLARETDVARADVHGARLARLRLRRDMILAGWA